MNNPPPSDPYGSDPYGQSPAPQDEPGHPSSEQSPYPDQSSGSQPGYPPGSQPGSQPGYPPGQQSGYPPSYQPGYPPPPPPQVKNTNTMAIVSLVCSLSGIILYITAPVGAILGHVARKQIRERDEEGDGLALAGIIIGWILTGLIVLACCVVGFLMALGIIASASTAP